MKELYHILRPKTFHLCLHTKFRQIQPTQMAIFRLHHSFFDRRAWRKSCQQTVSGAIFLIANIILQGESIFEEISKVQRDHVDLLQSCITTKWQKEDCSSHLLKSIVPNIYSKTDLWCIKRFSEVNYTNYCDDWPKDSKIYRCGQSGYPSGQAVHQKKNMSCIFPIICNLAIVKH